jgi:shikimate kinase
MVLPHTVSLIGMPGSGKSTVGVLLAKELGLGFIDTDLEIQVRHQATLQHILDSAGYLKLRTYEESVLLDIPLSGRLISTGGSAVYSDKAMQRLATAGPIVFLDVGLKELQRRVDNESSRGIARAPGQDFAGLFGERTPLYRAHANLIIEAEHASAQACARDIARQLLH